MFLPKLVTRTNGIAHIVPISVLFASLLASVFAAPRSGAADEPLSVGVTVGPQAMIVEELGRELVSVSVLLPPGSNHESYEPNFRQLQTLGKTSVFFAVGHPRFGFEQAWIPKLRRMAPKMEIVGTTSAELHRTDDIHIWLSFTGMQAMSQVIAAELARRLPLHTDLIRERAARLATRLSELRSNLDVRARNRTVPPFLSIHPSWTSLAAELGVEQIVLEACGKEATLHSASTILDDAKKRGVRVFLIEPGSPKQQVAFFAKTLGATTTAIDPLARDWFASIAAFADAVVDDREHT